MNEGVEKVNEETKRCALTCPGKFQGRRRELVRRKGLPDRARDAAWEACQPPSPQVGAAPRSGSPRASRQPVTLTTNWKKKNNPEGAEAFRLSRDMWQSGAGLPGLEAEAGSRETCLESKRGARP